jgi:hypothetical protein
VRFFGEGIAGAASSEVRVELQVYILEVGTKAQFSKGAVFAHAYIVGPFWGQE